MPTPEEIESTGAPLTRDELIALIARAHQASTYGESALAGRTLAAQSRLPKVIAENLGAGFGQWDFFPEAADIVDFALAYTSPATEEELWTMARAWASDDAAARQTLIALIGREILQHELRRIDVPKLRDLLDEAKPARARELRVSLGLEVRALAPAKAESKRSKPTVAASPAPAAHQTKPAASPFAAASVPAPASVSAGPREIPTRMPKPQFKRPPKPAPPADAKKFQHPKFGEGVLESQDGVGPEAKLTIKFDTGSKTLLARYVTELS